MTYPHQAAFLKKLDMVAIPFMLTFASLLVDDESVDANVPWRLSPTSGNRVMFLSAVIMTGSSHLDEIAEDEYDDEDDALSEDELDDDAECEAEDEKAVVEELFLLLACIISSMSNSYL